MYKKMLFAGCLVTLAVVVGLTTSCSRETYKGKIGLTCMDLTNPFFKLIANVMEQEADKYGYKIVALSAEKDAAKQNSQIADFIAQGCDAIFLNPTDSKGALEGLKAAHAAGIPVFTYDVQVEGEGVEDLIVSHIGSDNYQGGRLAGESMMKVTGDKGKIAIISYPEVSSCILRVNGFKDYLKENNSKLEIVKELSGLGNTEDGYKVATDILQVNADIVGIFAINDPSGMGAYSAVAKAGLTDQITIVAFDASPLGKQAVFEKKLYDTPQQFPRKMAVGTVQSFIDHLEGKDVQKMIFIPCAHYYYETSANDPTREAEQW
jgi:ribose transport system substrate-binding protein